MALNDIERCQLLASVEREFGWCGVGNDPGTTGLVCQLVEQGEPGLEQGQEAGAGRGLVPCDPSRVGQDGGVLGADTFEITVAWPLERLVSRSVRVRLSYNRRVGRRQV